MLAPSDVAYAVRTLVSQEPNSFISEIILRPTRKP
jgi:NADP-dependent 3-hydroxy acid dehydrogenase YdfG